MKNRRGEGEPFWKRASPSLLRTSPLSPPKTFDFIESLFGVFPVNPKTGARYNIFQFKDFSLFNQFYKECRLLQRNRTRFPLSSHNRSLWRERGGVRGKAREALLSPKYQPTTRIFTMKPGKLYGVGIGPGRPSVPDPPGGGRAALRRCNLYRHLPKRIEQRFPVRGRIPRAARRNPSPDIQHVA